MTRELIDTGRVAKSGVNLVNETLNEKNLIRVWNT